MTGRAVLVTGASRGIGRAVAQAFAGQGDRVAVHYRESAELAAAVLAGLPGSGHAIVQADLADPDAVRQMVDGASAELGGLDVLVNNAGTYDPHPITDTSYEQWQAAWQAVTTTPSWIARSSFSAVRRALRRRLRNSASVRSVSDPARGRDSRLPALRRPRQGSRRQF